MSSPTIAPLRRGECDLLADISRLSPERRLAEYRAGRFSHHQLTLWAQAFPEEVPLVNGELPWIALGLADLE